MATEKDKQELKLTEAGDGSVVVQGFTDEDQNDTQQQQPGTEAATGEGEQRQEAADDATTRDEGDDEAADEAAASQAATEVERQQIRARRREEREHKKRARIEREQEMQTALQLRDQRIAQLEEQIGVVTKKVSGSELAQLDSAITEAENLHKHFKGVMQQAITAQDGETAVEAADRMAQAQERRNQLKGLRQRMTSAKSENQPLQPDPMMKAQANAWMSRNKWYQPNSTDTDSQVATAIDAALTEEKLLDPRTPAYWEEFDKRLSRYLPHRVKGGSITPTTREKPRSPVGGSSREAGSASGATEYRLSSERVQALKEAGMWDDPVQRAKGIARYRDYDRKQQAGRSV